jgi:carbon-monoxide dehydrogenase medium subunit
MKPPPFSYHDPKTVSDVVVLLGRLDNAKLLAGGQSLMPMLNMRFVLPDHVIDLNKVEGLSLMHEAIQQVGHRQTRNRGTIGGSLCHLDPSAELVTVAAAHEATVTVTGPNGKREIAFAAFPVAFMTPAIEPTELLTAVRIPLWSPDHGYAFVEFARRHGDFAIVSAAALLEEDGAGRITRASVVLGGAAVLPVRAGEVEQGLIGQVPTDDLLRELCESCRKVEAIEDVHAPASYRQHLAAVLSRRALQPARGGLPTFRSRARGTTMSAR